MQPRAIIAFVLCLILCLGGSNFQAGTAIPKAEHRLLQRHLVDFAATRFGVELFEDPSLSAVAADHSLVLSTGAKVDTHHFMRQSMSVHGILDPFPYVFHGSAPRRMIEELDRTLIEHLQRMPQAEGRLYTHFGIGWHRREKRRLWFKREEWFVTVLLTQRALSFRALPRDLRPGDRFSFEGEIHAPFRNPKILLTRPDGTTEELMDFSDDSQYFRTHVRLGQAPGEYQLEVLGRYDMGPRVLGLCSLFPKEPDETLAYDRLLAAARTGRLEPSRELPTITPAATEKEAEAELVKLVNRDRREAGVRPLMLDEALCHVARGHSKDMRDNDFFAHVSPSSGRLSNRAEEAGIAYQRIGENIAVGQNVIDAQAALMRSPGHRMNLLNPAFTHLGVGVVFDTDMEGKRRVYVTQNFLRPPTP